MASKVRKSRNLKRLWRGMPGAVSAEMVTVLDRGGRALQAKMRANTPRRTGRLQAAILYRVLPKTLRLRVGLIGPKRERLFYGRIQDLGRKAQVVTVSRRKVAGSTLVNRRRVAHPSYLLRVRAMKAKRFVTGRYPDLRATIGNDLRGIWDRSLKRLALNGSTYE
jgi:hypothetical protein